MLGTDALAGNGFQAQHARGLSGVRCEFLAGNVDKGLLPGLSGRVNFVPGYLHLPKPRPVVLRDCHIDYAGGFDEMDGETLLSRSEMLRAHMGSGGFAITERFHKYVLAGVIDAARPVEPETARLRAGRPGEVPHYFRPAVGVARLNPELRSDEDHSPLRLNRSATRAQSPKTSGGAKGKRASDSTVNRWRRQREPREDPGVQDAEFEQWLTGQLASLPGVLAVALGGSRAQGTNRPNSDWDFGVYYQGQFEPQSLREKGWPGEVSEVGGWGGGVMNGGAWLTIDGRRVDVHYRNLDQVEHWCAEAQVGRFEKELLLFYVAGIPTYVVMGELATNRVLTGDLARPGYPELLATSAGRRWRRDALSSLGYAAAALRARRDLTVALSNAGPRARRSSSLCPGVPRTMGAKRKGDRGAGGPGRILAANPACG